MSAWRRSTSSTRRLTERLWFSLSAMAAMAAMAAVVMVATVAAAAITAAGVMDVTVAAAAAAAAVSALVLAASAGGGAAAAAAAADIGAGGAAIDTGAITVTVTSLLLARSTLSGSVFEGSSTTIEFQPTMIIKSHMSATTALAYEL